MKPEEVRKHVGQRVTLTLSPGVEGGPSVTGHLTGVIEAADGLVVFVEPEGSPGKKLSFHYHYILGITPAGAAPRGR